MVYIIHKLKSLLIIEFDSKYNAVKLFKKLYRYNFINADCKFPIALKHF